jgi:hypothetical protein
MTAFQDTVSSSRLDKTGVSNFVTIGTLEILDTSMDVLVDDDGSDESLDSDKTLDPQPVNMPKAMTKTVQNDQ